MEYLAERPLFLHVVAIQLVKQYNRQNMTTL
jgi:hypothetical protein